MNANNRLLFVMDRHCVLCAIRNKVLITIHVSLTMCVLGISSAAHSYVSVSEQHTQKGPAGDLTKHVHAR